MPPRKKTGGSAYVIYYPKNQSLINSNAAIDAQKKKEFGQIYSVNMHNDKMKPIHAGNGIIQDIYNRIKGILIPRRNRVIPTPTTNIIRRLRRNRVIPTKIIKQLSSTVRPSLKTSASDISKSERNLQFKKQKSSSIQKLLGIEETARDRLNKEMKNFKPSEIEKERMLKILTRNPDEEHKKKEDEIRKYYDNTKGKGRGKKKRQGGLFWSDVYHKVTGR